MDAAPAAIYAHVRRWLAEERRRAGVPDAPQDQEQEQQCGGPCPAFVAAIQELDFIDPTPAQTNRNRAKV
jgi:hypothetical protein